MPSNIAHGRAVLHDPLVACSCSAYSSSRVSSVMPFEPSGGLRREGAEGAEKGCQRNLKNKAKTRGVKLVMKNDVGTHWSQKAQTR
jgi:hypothetical protein